MGLFVYTVFGSIISVHSGIVFAVSCLNKIAGIRSEGQGIVFAVSCLVNRFLKHFFNAIL